MKKKIFCLLLILIIPLIMLCGCASEEAETNGGADRFKMVNYENCDILIDRETRVMYLCRISGYGGGLTVMLNADGTPMLWEGELKGE